MSSFVLTLLVMALLLVAVKAAPALIKATLARVMDDRASRQRAGRRYFAVELPVTYFEGEEAMTRAWTALAPFLSRSPLELCYDAVGTPSGVEVEAIVGCEPGDYRRVKETLRRAFDGKVSFRDLKEDPFDEMHERLVRAEEDVHTSEDGSTEDRLS